MASSASPALELQSMRIPSHSTQLDDEAAEITHVRIALRDEATAAAASAASVNEEHPRPSRHHSRRRRSGMQSNSQALDADQETVAGNSGAGSILLPASARAASSSVAAAPVAPALQSQLHAPASLAPAPAASSVNSHLILQSFPAFFSLSLAAPDYNSSSEQQQQLASLPSDCLFCMLLHLDGSSLAALSRCSTALCSLVEGEDSAPVWRGLARADVARLFSHERAALAFAEPHTPAGDDEEGGGAPIPSAMRRAQQQQAAMDPRTQYLLRLKQRRMTLQGASIELQRLRLRLAQIREADSVYVRRQLRIESVFLLTFPTMMLASSILLLCSSAGALPRRQASWIVLLPVWALLLCLPLLGLGMHQLRVQFLARKRQERADAAAAPPTVGATPSTSTRGRSQQQQQQQQQNQLQVPQGSAGAAGAVPASPSSSSAANAASAAVARTRSRAAAEAALQRERRNNRFLAGAARAAEARGIGRGAAAAGSTAAASASAAASNALIAQAHDGLLARLLESHFDTAAHCAVNGARVGLIAASTVLLAVKLSVPADAAAAGLPYTVVFAPLYALGLYALCHPLLPGWCASSDESSRAEFAGSTVAFARRHTIQCVQFTLAPLLTLLLLGLHLDDFGSVSHLAYALVPLWIWQGAACLMLLVWALRFGAGITAGFEIAPALAPSPSSAAASLSPASVSSSVSIQMVSVPPLSQSPQMQAPMIAALPPPALVMEDGSAAAAGAAPSAAPSCWSRLFAACCAPLLRLRFRTRRHNDHRNVRLALTLVAVLLVVACLVLFEALLCVDSISPPPLRMIPLVVAWSIGSALCVASVMRMKAQLAEAEYARLTADTQARMIRV